MDKILAFLAKIPLFKLFIPLYICLAGLFAVLIMNGNVQLLNPAGYIADIQSRILWGAIIFAALVGGTIVISFFFVVFRYKEGVRQKRRYEPEWVAGKGLQLLGWGIPLIAIIVIAVMIWATAHGVDPYLPIASSKAPLTIQVVSERWKWLFLYPNERIATVNMLEIPVGTPVAFQLTADSPMNSFWVPRLGGQIYTMTGMVTQLHLEAGKVGNYAGSTNEISGDGFAGMGFTVKAVTQQTYDAWISAARTAHLFDYASYIQFARPSTYNPVALYKLADPNLFNEIVMRYMAPSFPSQQTNGVTQ